CALNVAHRQTIETAAVHVPAFWPVPRFERDEAIATLGRWSVVRPLGWPLYPRGRSAPARRSLLPEPRKMRWALSSAESRRNRTAAHRRAALRECGRGAPVRVARPESRRDGRS